MWRKTFICFLCEATMARKPEDNFRDVQDLAYQVNVEYNAAYESERLRAWGHSMCLGVAGAAGACAFARFAKTRAFSAGTRVTAGAAGFGAGFSLANRVFGKSDGAHKVAGDEGCNFYRLHVDELLREFYQDPTADNAASVAAAKARYLEIKKNWPPPRAGAMAIAAGKCAVDSTKRGKPEECKVWGGMQWRSPPFGNWLVFGGGSVGPCQPLLAILPCYLLPVLMDEAMRSYKGPRARDTCAERTGARDDA